MIPLKPTVSLPHFFQGITTAQGGVLLLDYDGTLAPFHKERDQAFPYSGIRERLSQLIKNRHTQVVIISGRNVRELVPLLGVTPHPELWGCHGWEWLTSEGDYGHYPLGENAQKGLDQAYHYIMTTPYHSNIEKKPFSLALHWRGVDAFKIQEMEKTVLVMWDSLADDHNLELFPFDGGVELRSQGRTKGDVITTLISRHDGSKPIAYLGDDLTDEQAFATLADKGLKILVRKEHRSTQADIQLIPPRGLLEFLDEWVEAEKS